MTHPVERYAVCEQALRQGSFAADAAAARAAGVAAIGVDAEAVDAVGPDEARRILDGEGLMASSYITLAPILGADGSTAALDDARRRLDVAAALGAPGALVATGSLGGRVAADADATCRAWLARAARLGLDREVRLMLEPVHPLMRQWSFVHTLRHALTLVEGIDGAGVVLDLGHVWWEHGLDELVRDHVAQIVTVQVTNIDRSALDELRYERAPLETGDVPVAALVAALETAGYRGWYEDETIVRLARERRVDMIRRSRTWFEAL